MPAMADARGMRATGGGLSVDDEGTGVLPDGFEMTIDPSRIWSSFSDHLLGRAIVIWFDRCEIQPMEPIDTGIDSRMDLDAIVQHSTWQGTFVAPRVKTQDELSHEVEEQMRQIERQFILRNLGRAERYTDPKDPLPLDRETVERSSVESPDLNEIRKLKYSQPDFGNDSSIEYVRGELDWRRKLYAELPWGDHFSVEVNATFDGPLWQRDPFNPPPPRETDIEAAPVDLDVDAASAEEEGA
ncbi:MAG: hypothetical protein ACI9MR_005169 [Myxococcota bacterium]|jgi:hypothetical protein